MVKFPTVVSKFVGLSIMAILPLSANGDDWSRPAFLAVTAIDLAQTHDIRKQYPHLYEMNPILGKHPSAGQINTYFIGSTLLILGLCESFRELSSACFTGAAIGRAAVVINNHFIGAEVRFPIH